MRGKSTAKIVSVVILWMIGASLISLIVFSNQNETKIVYISGIKSDKIIAGYSIIKAEEISQMSFAGRSYDIVIVGFANRTTSELTYLGLSSGKYYKSTEVISSGLLQRIKNVEVAGQRLVIDYVKNTATVIILSVWLFVILGGIGFAVIYTK